MGDILLATEVGINASAETVFALFGARHDSGWLFGADVSEVRPGAVVRMSLPVRGRGSDLPVEGTARITEVVPCSRIVLRHETPWAGKVVITLREHAGQTLVRVVASLDEGSVQWTGERMGLELAPEPFDPHAIRIGLVAPLCGAAGVFGRAVDNCARLAVSEINAAGGVLGRPLHLITVDDASDPGLARERLDRLLAGDGVHALNGNHDSRVYRAIRPSVKQAGIPYLYGVVNEGGAEEGYLFRLGEVPSDQLAQSVPTMMQETGSRDWFIVGSDYCWPREFGKCARRVIVAAGGRVLGERYLSFGDRDFAGVLEEIDHSGAENILSSMVGRDAAAFEREFYAAGLRSRTRTLGALVDEATRELIGDEAAAGIWSVFGYFSDLATEENQRFVRAYEKQYGRWAPPLSSISECAYEAVHLFAAASTKARSIEPAAVARALLHTTIEGPRGAVRVGPERRLEQRIYLAEAVPGGFDVRQDFGLTPHAA
jgi:branched-chain amino acid transport system substrate-binding protein